MKALTYVQALELKALINVLSSLLHHLVLSFPGPQKAPVFMQKLSLFILLALLYLMPESQAMSTKNCVEELEEKCKGKTLGVYYAFHYPEISEKAPHPVVKFGYWTPKKDNMENIIKGRYSLEESRLVTQCLGDRVKLTWTEDDGYYYQFPFVDDISKVKSAKSSLVDADKKILELNSKLDALKKEVMECVKKRWVFLGAIMCRANEKCLDARFKCVTKSESSYGITPVTTIRAKIPGFSFDFTPMRLLAKLLVAGHTEFYYYNPPEDEKKGKSKEINNGIANIGKVLFDIFTTELTVKGSRTVKGSTAPGLECIRYGPHNGHNWLQTESMGTLVPKKENKGIEIKPVILTQGTAILNKPLFMSAPNKDDLTKQNYDTNKVVKQVFSELANEDKLHVEQDTPVHPIQVTSMRSTSGPGTLSPLDV